MTGFPIAVGAGPRHSSSRPFTQAEHVIMAMGVNDDETLEATVFISYHFHPTNHLKNSTDEESTGTSSNHHSDDDSAAAAELDGDNHFNVIAELRVQISHIASPLVSNSDAMSNRETKSRVPLGVMKKKTGSSRYSNRADKNQISQNCAVFTPNASVTFSSSLSHLACLIPVPTGYELVSAAASQSSTGHDTNHNPSLSSVSTIVIFNIQTYTITSRQQIRQRNKALPKLPDYILEQPDESSISEHYPVGWNNNSEMFQTNDDDHDTIRDERQQQPKNFKAYHTFNGETQNVSYVAHVPKIVRVGLDDFGVHLPCLQSATCMCNMPSDSRNGKGPNAFSTLLVGTINGSLLIIDFATAKVKDCLYETNHLDGGANNVNTTSASPIIDLSQCPPTQWKPHNKYGDELGSKSKGRISATTKNGGISIFNTTFYGVNRQFSDIDQSREYVNKSGLIMTIEPVVAVRPQEDATKSSNMSDLRFACAKWLNPSILAVLTRSRYQDKDFPLQQQGALSEIVVAQVWSVTEVQEVSEISDHAAPKSNICVMSELKFPSEDSLIEQAHGSFSLSQEPPEHEASYGRNYSISYDNYRDCLALSSQLISYDPDAEEVIKMRPFCMAWDWKRNAQGLTLTADTTHSSRKVHNDRCIPSIFSQFLVSKDCAIHFYEKAYAQKKRLHKDIYNLGTLSPSSVSGEGLTVLRLCEASPLMLRGDVITYPLVESPLATPNFSLRWEESRIPSSYVASNGPCRIAAIGKDKGRSIAVAASRGLCILDLSRTSWQMTDLEHGNEITTPCVKGDSDAGSPRSQHLPLCPQWKLFSNMSDEQQFRVISFAWWESSNDDFLLAVVQYMTIKEPHLVCWSRRRLGFGENQLLVEKNEYFARQDDYTKLFSTYGLALPNGFRVESMSIMKDPAGLDRALLLLSSISNDEKSCSINYSLYQLQVKKLSRKTPERVLAKLSAHGNIPLTVGTSPGMSTSEAITGVFLAGGSFLYDLGTDESQYENDGFGVIGITSLFLDLCVACVSHTGPILYKPCLLEKRNTTTACSLGTRKSIVACYWVSDSFLSDKPCGRIVWNIAKNDGKVYCWAAPCFSSCASTEGLQMASRNSPTKPYMLGEICDLGCSLLWMNGPTLNGNDIALGPFLPNHFGCTLFAGQSSRIIRPRSEVKEIPSFHVSNLVIALPTFTPSLFLFLLSLAKLDKMSTCETIEKKYVRMKLLKANNNGSSRSALRVIILKVLDLLDQSKGNQSRCQEWSEGMKILRELVSVAREVFDALSFASFFLSVGRQLEPHQFDLIFPLPSEGCTGISAEDLFMVAVKKGSLSVALTGLSLFSCHQESQNRVVQLLCHCFAKIDEVLDLNATFSLEEETFLHQLYWFGVKLEDAIIAEKAEEDINLSESAIISNSSTSFDESSIDDVSSEDFSVATSEDSSTSFLQEKSRDASFLSCRSKPREGLVTKVVSRIFPTAWAPKNNSFEETAIYEAATSFIVSGFDYDDKAFTSTKVNGTCNDETKHGGNDIFDTPMVTVAGSTCTFLSHIIGLNCKATCRAGGWKVASTIAYLIQGDTDTVTISNAASLNAVRISQMVTVDDLREICISADHISSERERCKAHNKIVSCLEHLASQCRDQIHTDGVEFILNLVLLLLLRHDICKVVQLRRDELILIGIVCGHLSGRITDLIDLSQESDVCLIYQALSRK